MKFTFEEKLAAVKLHKEKGIYKYPKGYEAESKKQRTYSMSGSGKRSMIVTARKESGMD